MRKHLRRLLLVGIVGALGLSLAPSRAAFTEVGFAELKNASDGAKYTTQPQDPNITCDVKVYGSPLLVHVPFIVGELYGKDIAIAEGTCLSFDGTPVWQTKLSVNIEYFANGVWNRTSFWATGLENSKFGTSVVKKQVQGTYPGTSVYLRHPHRGHAYLYNSRSGTTREAVTPSTWYMM